MAEAAAARAASLECWDTLGQVTLASTADAAVSAELELGSGRTNQNFIATAVQPQDGDHDAPRRFFVRIGSDIPAYGVTRLKEQAAGRAAAAAGIAPQVLFTADDAMVTEFATGRTLTGAQLKEACAAGAGSELLSEVVDAVRKLHATPPPPELNAAAGDGNPDSRWAPRDMWRWLALAEEKGYSRLPVVEEARSLVASLEAVAGEPSDDCFCHYDLLPDNLIRQPGGGAVSVIDFEYAGCGQRLMDLAIMSMGCALAPEEEANLLTAYTGAPPAADMLRGFAALKVLACLRETLWGVTAEVSGASALPASEAIAYADENFEKLKTFRAAFEQAESESKARQ